MGTKKENNIEEGADKVEDVACPLRFISLATPFLSVQCQ